MMRGEVKGITHLVKLTGEPITGWNNYSLPMDSAANMRPSRASHEDKNAAAGPHFLFAKFNVATPGDVFLDVSALGKGALWINGHAIGRYWNEGPQKTLFVPGPWLHTGSNEVVIFDLSHSASDHPMLAGLAHPILNAATADAEPHTTATNSPQTK